MYYIEDCSKKGQEHQARYLVLSFCDAHCFLNFLTLVVEEIFTIKPVLAPSTHSYGQFKGLRQYSTVTEYFSYFFVQYVIVRCTQECLLNINHVNVRFLSYFWLAHFKKQIFNLTFKFFRPHLDYEKYYISTLMFNEIIYVN